MITFHKYQGAGNDFILVDQRKEAHIQRSAQRWIEKVCNRRFGIGADGLILLQNKQGYDFEMIYFNADGRESSMCGNGGRCISAFAHDLGIFRDKCRFWAIDGEHEAVYNAAAQEYQAWIELKMTAVDQVELLDNAFVLNTGSPHYVRFDDSVESLDMVQEGRKIRYSTRFKAEGINVNLVSPLQDEAGLRIRTYERGVEDETLACGTGVTAAALAWHQKQNLPPGSYTFKLQASGGQLSVRFEATAQHRYQNIWLCGPAAFVFSGNIAYP